MKIRLHRDSIRLRLTPADVQQLRQAGLVREATGFGAGAELICQLRADPAAGEVTAQFAAGTVDVRVPAGQLQDWADGDAVGIRAVQGIGGERVLKILIEKDFECMHQEDAEPGEVYYPNPEKARC